MAKVIRLKDLPYSARRKNYSSQFPMEHLNNRKKLFLMIGFWSEDYKTLDVHFDFYDGINSSILYARHQNDHWIYAHARKICESGKIMATGVLIYAALRMTKLFTVKLPSEEKEMLNNFKDWKMGDYRMRIEQIKKTFFDEKGLMKKRKEDLTMQYYIKDYRANLDNYCPLLEIAMERGLDFIN